MKYLPKLQQLKVFQQVIRSGSVRAASRQLGLSQPAVSRTLKELEQLLETPLFIRGAQGSVLTEAGQAFALRTTWVLEELQRAVGEVQQISQEQQGAITVGFSSLIALTVLPEIMNAFRSRFPLVEIRIKEAQLSSLYPALRAGEIDFVVGSLNTGSSLDGLIIEPLFSASFCVIARRGHPLAEARSIQELSEAKWLFPETDMGYYRQLQLALGTFYQQLEIPPVYTDSVVCGLNLVLKADYLTVVAQAMCAPFALEHQLTVLPINDLPQAQYCAFYSQKSPLTAPARRFLQQMRAHCQRYEW